MLPGRAHFASDLLKDFVGAFSVKKMTDVLFCAQTNHNSQVIFGGRIEDIRRRNSVLYTNGIYSIANHHREVAANLVDVMELLARVISPERTVGYALDEEFLRTYKDKFSGNRRPEVRTHR